MLSQLAFIEGAVIPVACESIQFVDHNKIKLMFLSILDHL